MLLVANGKLADSGRLGDNLFIGVGRKAAIITLLNALAVAKKQFGVLKCCDQ
jgi:hypothetical protein